MLSFHPFEMTDCCRVQGPISLTIFPSQFSSNSITDDHIATKFGTCHDSPAVVPCAKYCSDHLISIWMGAKWNFHRIWIVMEKLLVKWAPGLVAIACFVLAKRLWKCLSKWCCKDEPIVEKRSQQKSKHIPACTHHRDRSPLWGDGILCYFLSPNVESLS